MSWLFRNASWGGASALIRLLFGMGNLFLAVKLAGPALYGYFVVMTSFFTLYVSLVNSVNVIAVTNAVEIRNQKNSIDKQQTLFAAVWTLTMLGVGILLVIAFFLAIPFLPDFIYKEGNVHVEEQVSVLLVAAVFIAVCQIISAGNVAVIECLGRFDLAAKAQMFGTPIAFILFLVFGFSFAYQVNIAEIGLLLSAGAAINLLCVTIVRLKMGYLSSFKPTLQAFKLLPTLLGQGLTLQGARLINVFFDPLNKFMLNYFVGPVSVSTYEMAMKMFWGIQVVFGGAFRSFLQLADKLKLDGSKDYINVVRYGFVPAITMYALGCILMVMISRYWMMGEMNSLPAFYLLLILPGIGIIFASPLYNALVGIRDLRFIFRMHVNLAVLNLLASLTLIPAFGLYGAGIGLLLTTAYNAIAEYRRYIQMIGPIIGLREEIGRRVKAIALPLTIAVFAVAADRFVDNADNLLIMEGIAVAVLLGMLGCEPISARLIKGGINRLQKLRM